MQVMSVTAATSPSQTTPPARRPWVESAITTLLVLRQRFPLAFAPLNARVRRPLKIGIDGDLRAALPDVDPVMIGRALGFYCSGGEYRHACTEGAERVDLNGNPCGAITADEAEYAKQLLAGRRKHHSKPALIPAKPKVTLADLKNSAANRKLAKAAGGKP
jgi:ProP effector